MPKIKTHKATAKRFRRTSTGKLVRMYQGRGHLRRNKAKRTLVKYRKNVIVEAPSAEKRVTQLAPNLD